MEKTRTNQTETAAAVRRNGGRQGESQGQEVTVSGQGHGRSMTTPGRESRALGRRGSRDFAATSPFSMMRQLSREMDRLMDSFFDARFGSLLSDPWTRDEDQELHSMWTPRIDVRRRDDAIVVRADLPGVRKEDVQIEVADNALILSGERREEREEGAEDQDYHVFERSYGTFYRAVPLPEGTDVDKVKAEMRNGVLNVTIPLPETARPRRIKIDS